VDERFSRGGEPAELMKSVDSQENGGVGFGRPGPGKHPPTSALHLRGLSTPALQHPQPAGVGTSPPSAAQHRHFTTLTLALLPPSSPRAPELWLKRCAAPAKLPT
jgi:hypothetical protein